MNKEIQFLISLLKQTPSRLKVLLNALDYSLLEFKPNPNHFSILDILGHLIHGEDKDWIPRLQLTLQEYQPKYTSFDRIGHRQFIEDTPIEELVEMFTMKRYDNLEILAQMELNEDKLQREAIHPTLGMVNINQLLHTWVVHDLSHLNQINRILATRFNEVGPWKQYLRILNDT